MHARRVGDRTLSFIVSGKLWRNSLIMQDRETGSLWSHVTGECLEGELAGTTLAQVPVVQTTWRAWRAAHPDTRVLKKDGEITSSRYEAYFADPARNGLFRTTWLQDRLPGKSLVHGVVLGAHSVAVTDDALPAGASVDAELGGVPVRLVRAADGGVRASRLDSGAALQAHTAFWFAWSSYFPRTAVID